LLPHSTEICVVKIKSVKISHIETFVSQGQFEPTSHETKSPRTYSNGWVHIAHKGTFFPMGNIVKVIGKLPWHSRPWI
jgi:hypothetical protein